MRYLLALLLPILAFSLDAPLHLIGHLKNNKPRKQSEPNFTLFTLPKSGTHMLIKLFENPEFDQYRLKGESTPSFLWYHFWEFNPQSVKFSSNHKFILNTRDIRDLAISLTEYCIETNLNPFLGNGPSEDQAHRDWLALPYLDKIKALFQPEIWEKSRLYKECEALETFLAQTPNDRIYLTSFEKLVGPQGKGDRGIQRREIKNISNFLGIQLSYAQINRITDSLFGGTRTFRQGRIGRWKELFNDELNDLANQYLESSPIRHLIEYNPD